MSNFFPFLGFYAVGARKVLGFRRKDLFPAGPVRVGRPFRE